MEKTAPLLLDQLDEIGFGKRLHDTLYRMIDKQPVFRDFTPQEIEQLMLYLRAYDADKGVTLIREGQRDNYLIWMLDGRAGVFKTDAHGETKQIATVRSGSLMGEISIIDNFPPSATVITETPVRLVILSRYNLEKISSEHPSLGAKLLWQLAIQLSVRLRQASGRLVDHL